MNKKLIMAAIGAALAAGPMMAAQAAPTVYGHLHMSWDSYDNGGSKPAVSGSYIFPISAVSDTSNGMLSSNSSRFGIKGDEDLGGGLKAIYQVESGAFDAATGSGGLGGTLRNTFIGFADSAWGSVKFGRHDSPVKDLSRKIDAFNEQIGDMRIAIGYARFDNRASNMIRYDSPSFSGIQAAVQYAASESNTDTCPPNTTFTTAPSCSPSTGLTAANVTWTGGPFFVGLGYEVHKFHDDSQDDESDVRLVGKWNIMPELYVAAIYDDVSNLYGSKDPSIGGKTYGLGAGYKIANNLLKVNYGKADATDKASPDNGASFWALGVDHSFSKTTMVYLDYAKASNDDGQNINVSSGYGGHGTANIPAVGAGASPSAISVGMIVNF